MNKASQNVIMIMKTLVNRYAEPTDEAIVLKLDSSLSTEKGVRLAIYLAEVAYSLCRVLEKFSEHPIACRQ